MSSVDEITLEEVRPETLSESEQTAIAQEHAAADDECVIAPNVMVAVNFYDERGRTNRKTALGIVLLDQGEYSFKVRLIYPVQLNNVEIGVQARDLMPLYQRPEGHDGDFDERELLGAILFLARRLDKRDRTQNNLRNQITTHGGKPCC